MFLIYMDYLLPRSECIENQKVELNKMHENR